MSRRKQVLAIQDTTFLNYTPHPQTEGLGAIGNKRQQQRGLGLHSTLAVAPSGLPLGLLDQRWLVRPLDEPSHQPEELRQRPIEAKESYRWLEGMRQAEALTPAGVQLIHVADAEADIYEFLVEIEQRDNYFVVRAGSDRCLLSEETESADKLWARLEEQAVLAERTITIQSNQKRKARQATVAIRTAQVTLKPPYRPGGQKLPPLTIQAILVREEQPPAEVDEPIEWLLLTNRPLHNKGQVLQAVDWFALRWQIELFHRILKSGCNVEDCRLQTADRLQKYITLMSVIAWRIHFLTYLNRTQPDAPCTLVLTVVEAEALYMRIHRTATLPDALPSIRQAIRWIARLGGFLGRKGDGQPGHTTIWRGWQRLQDLAATWYLVKEHNPLTYG
jgi:hypothetical protein